MTLNCYKFEFSRNVAFVISQIWEAKTATCTNEDSLGHRQLSKSKCRPRLLAYIIDYIDV